MLYIIYLFTKSNLLYLYLFLSFYTLIYTYITYPYLFIKNIKNFYIII